MFARCALASIVSLSLGCACGAPAPIAPPTIAIEPPSPAPPSSVIAPPADAAHVDLLWVTELYAPGLDAPSDDAPTLGAVAITPTHAGAPSDAAPTPLGELFEHEGRYHVEAIRDVPAPYPTITRVGRDGTCEAPVTRAVEAGVHFLDGEDTSEGTRLVLFVGACDGAGVTSNAIGGAPLRWRALAIETASAATPAVAAAVRARGGDAAATITALSLSAPDAFVAYDGDVWYVVRDGVVQWSPARAPLAEVAVGDRVFVLASSSEDDTLRAIDDADRPE